MYHADTSQHTVWACDYDPGAGAAANKRVFARVEEGGLFAFAAPVPGLPAKRVRADG